MVRWCADEGNLKRRCLTVDSIGHGFETTVLGSAEKSAAGPELALNLP